MRFIKLALTLTLLIAAFPAGYFSTQAISAAFSPRHDFTIHVIASGGGVASCGTNGTQPGCYVQAPSTSTLTDADGHVWSFQQTGAVEVGQGYPGEWIILRDGIIACCNAQGLRLFGGDNGGGFVSAMQLDANRRIRTQGWLGFWYQTDNVNRNTPQPGVLPSFDSLSYYVYAPTRVVLAADPAWITLASGAPAISIGIGAPGSIFDTGAPAYAAASLTIEARTLPQPICGKVTLSDGTTEVTEGEVLTATQLTGLKFTPSAIALNSPRQCAFTYGVRDAAFSQAFGAAHFTVLPSGLWQDPPGAATSSGDVVAAPTVLQPAVAGDLVGIRYANASGASAAYITTPQVFMMGTVQPSDTLCAKPGGGSCSVYVQKDNINFYPDGSVKLTMLSYQRPAFTSTPGYIELMYAKCSGGGCPAAPTAPMTASALQASGYNPSNIFDYGHAGGSGTETKGCNAILASAISGGTVQTAYSGNVMAEYRVKETAASGQLTITCVMRVYTDGSTDTDYMVDNAHNFNVISGWVNQTDISYYVTLSDGFTFTGRPRPDGSVGSLGQGNFVDNRANTLWHHHIRSAGVDNLTDAFGTLNVQRDIPYLFATGAFGFYDISIGASLTHINDLWTCSSGCTTIPNIDYPLTHGQITEPMGNGGGRPDLGPQPNWVALALVSQNLRAYQGMLLASDAAGSIPWSHFNVANDPNSGHIPNGFTYDGTAPYDPLGAWQIDGQGIAHEPDVSYAAWLLRGDYYDLLNLETETNYNTWNNRSRFDSNGLDGNGYINVPGVALTDNSANLGFTGKGAVQPRNIGWYLRQDSETIFAIPDNDPAKTYFTTIGQKAYQGLVQADLSNVFFNGQYGQIKGVVGAATIANGYINYEQSYITTSAAVAAQMALPGISGYAKELIGDINRFDAGKVVNGRNGFDYRLSQFYYTPVNANQDTASGETTSAAGGQPALQTWAALQRSPQAFQNGDPHDGVPGMRPETTQFHGYITPAGGGESILTVTSLDSTNHIARNTTLISGPGIPPDTYIWDNMGGDGVAAGMPSPDNGNPSNGQYGLNKIGLTAGSAGAPIAIDGVVANVNGHPVDQFGNGTAGYIGGYPNMSKGAMGLNASVYPRYDTFQAYTYLRGAIWRAYHLDPGNFPDDLTSIRYAPMWNFVPQMPNGQWMFHNHEQFDVTNGATATLSSIVCNSLQYIEGNGTKTINGANNQVGCTDLMMSVTVPQPSGVVSGTTVFTGGATSGADAQMYGSCDPTTFHFGSGKNLAVIGAMCYTGQGGDSSAYVSSTPLSPTQIVQIDVNTTQPQQIGYQQNGDAILAGMKIGTFLPGTHVLKIKSTLNGRSYMADGQGGVGAAQFTSHCSVSGNDTLCDLGNGSILTVKGVTATANLTSSVFIF